MLRKGNSRIIHIIHLESGKNWMYTRFNDVAKFVAGISALFCKIFMAKKQIPDTFLRFG